MHIQYLKKFSDLFEEATKPVYQKYGFANLKLHANWVQIIGERLAAVCEPEKITYSGVEKKDGVLHIKVYNPAFSLEIESLRPRILNNLQIIMGYKAASKIRIAVANRAEVAIEAGVKPKKKLIKSDQPNFDDIEDQELKEALTELYSTL